MKPNPHITLAPRGLRRDQAAAYIGVSPSKFDDWVSRSIMPGAGRIDGICIWDRLALDAAFNGLFEAPAPKSSHKSWDALR